MSKYTERLENLIRVVKAIKDDKFDLRRWYDRTTHCGCGIGHALQDDYFIAQKFRPSLVDWEGIASFFGISLQKLKTLIVYYPGNETKADMLTKLRVLLMEKMAQEIDLNADVSIEAQMQMEDA